MKPQVQTWTEQRKVIGIPLEKSAKKGKDGTVTVKGYFTSDNMDEVGDIITRGATERAIPRYRQWGNIRYMHLPRPVAKVTGIGTDDGLEWNEVEIKVIDPQAVFEVEQGLLTALSVGISVKYDDIEFLEDGGWVINDYTLAEISLVDHPANYDARLKDLPVDQGLRMLARTYGMDALAKSMTNLLDREMAMSDVINQEEIVEEPVEEKEAELAPEIETEEPLEEEKAVEAEEVAEEAEEVEAEKELEPEAAIEEDVEAEPEAEVLDAEDEDIMAGMLTMVNDVLTEIKDLKQEFADYRKSLETHVEVPEAEEQIEGEEEAEKEANLIETDVEVDDEPEAAVERKGAVPETVLPEEVDEEDAEKSDNRSSLKQALTNYFANK